MQRADLLLIVVLVLAMLFMLLPMFFVPTDQDKGCP